MLLGCYVASMAGTLFPDEETVFNDVEYGVLSIQRICPSRMWDGLILRNIEYDRRKNEVILWVQIKSWDEPKDEVKFTEKMAQEETEWIVKNFMKGYYYLAEHQTILGEGDFMLFLSIGGLFKQMEDDGASLRIQLLKPDEECLVYKDIPFQMSSSELKTFLKDR